MSRVLLFHAGALGDFVLSWPLALAIKQWRPGCELLYITHASKGELALEYLGTPYRDLESGGWHLLHNNAAALPAASRELLAGSSVVVSFLARPGDAWLKHAQSITPQAEFLPLQSIPPAEFRRHALAFQRRQLAPELGAAFDAVLAELQDRGLRRPTGESGILIHPGSGSAKKCWPIARFITLARQLQRRSRVSFILGEVELEQWSAAQVQELKNVAPLLTPHRPLELAQQLQNAQLLIGNDSGPGHLAAMLGVATLSLFGPTPAAVWRPMGPRVKIVSSPTGELDGISVDEVLKAAGE